MRCQQLKRHSSIPSTRLPLSERLSNFSGISREVSIHGNYYKSWRIVSSKKNKSWRNFMALQTIEKPPFDPWRLLFEGYCWSYMSF
jgi:hypothetical protein